MRVERYTSVGALAAEWDALADAANVPPFLRPGWIGAWWDAFGSGTLDLVAVREGERLTGVLPVVRRAGGVHAPVNWHTPVFGAASLGAEPARAAYAAALASRPAYASLRFLDEGDTAAVDAFRDASYRTSVRTLLESPYLPLGTWEELPKRRAKELEKRQRKLGAELDVQDGRTGLAALLAEGFEIEGSGWKTAAGTAILSQPETERFYTDIARWAAGRGTLRLMFLRAGSRAVAFELGIVDGGSYFFVKGGYDPEFRKHAPGIVLMSEIIRWSCEQGLTTFEFLGAPDAQKLDWTSLLRRRVAIEAFAPTPAGRALELGGRYARPLAKRSAGVIRAAAKGARRGR